MCSKARKTKDAIGTVAEDTGQRGNRYQKNEIGLRQIQKVDRRPDQARQKKKMKIMDNNKIINM